MRRFWLIFGICYVLTVPAMGQMMPPQEDETPEAPAVTARITEPPPSWNQPMLRLRHMWIQYLGEDSPYRGLILCVLTLVVLTIVYRNATTWLTRYIRAKAYKPENADAFLRTWRTVWKFFIGVLTIIAASGSLKILGLSAGFLGMMLGWSLQAPVTGIAAWLMIITKKPFQIGDRIILAGYTGDVTDITLTHVILNQVGGSVGGEERSGRGILIPNAILFSNVIINYTLDQEYMLDEVLVRLTFDSDIELAEKLAVTAATEVTADIVGDSGFEPHTRSELYESGVLMRVRYQTIPSQRQRISSEITRKVLHAIKANFDKVRFCYPHSVVRYRHLDGDEGAPPALESPKA